TPALGPLVPGRAALARADGDLHAAVVQVLRMGMALRAVADDRHVLALDEGQIGVLVVVDLHDVLSSFVVWKMGGKCGLTSVRRGGCVRRGRCRWCRCGPFRGWRCGRSPR